VDCGHTQVVAQRLGDGPIVQAGSVPGYGPIFNAGVIVADDRFHLFARGVRDGYRRNNGPGPRFLDYISDVLVFTSDDGRSYDFQQVLAESSPAGVHSYEDPRVQRVRSGGGERTVMSYTNLPAPDSGGPWRVGVHRLGYEDGRYFLNRTSGRVIGPEGEPNKDAVLFNLRDGRVALIHRIYPNMQLALFDSLDGVWDPPPGYWDEHMSELERHTIISPSPGALAVGAGAPPIATEDGLILFYHERDAAGVYTTRVALLDDATGRVKSILPDPIMRPEAEWERSGDVDDVVFVQGAIVRADDIYLTYGAADRCVGAASVGRAELAAALRAA
jgi:beta-1,2-mannobiose phosphorylase / 1,2-beta-oligomannan phosphorylase